MTASPTPPLAPKWMVGLLAAGAFLASLLLYAHPLLHAVLIEDDFQILAQSWTWPKTVDGLWTTNNEHAMPLGRLLTFVLIQLAGRPTALPFAGVLAGVLGLFIGMGLTYVFVRRELGHPLYGLTALMLFGVSTVYQQAVYWFAASFSLYALDALLLALLAGQRYRETGRWRWLLACAVLCALAPCWFASGVLAGPFCCLYLLPHDGEERRTARARLVSWLVRLTPLLGTAAFLAVSLPRTAAVIQHLPHYNGATAVTAFRPLTGAQFTARSLVDNLALGVFGVWNKSVGLPVALVVLPALVAAGAWWAYQSPRRRLALLGAGMIFATYLLIYSARALWDYDRAGMQSPTWSRYHLQPQLGLALLVCGGLPRWAVVLQRTLSEASQRKPLTGITFSPLPGTPGRGVGGEGRVTAHHEETALFPQTPHPQPLSPEYRGEGSNAVVERAGWFRLFRFHLDASGRLTPRQTGALACLLVLSCLVQAPRGLFSYYPSDPTQAQTLSLIERASTFCREHHISADAARRELGVLAMPDSYTDVNGWEFLRGSDQPKEWSPEEIREMLDAAGVSGQ